MKERLIQKIVTERKCMSLTKTWKKEIYDYLHAIITIVFCDGNTAQNVAFIVDISSYLIISSGRL